MRTEQLRLVRVIKYDYLAAWSNRITRHHAGVIIVIIPAFRAACLEPIVRKFRAARVPVAKYRAINVP